MLDNITHDPFDKNANKVNLILWWWTFLNHLSSVFIMSLVAYIGYWGFYFLVSPPETSFLKFLVIAPLCIAFSVTFVGWMKLTGGIETNPHIFWLLKIKIYDKKSLVRLLTPKSWSELMDYENYPGCAIATVEPCRER